jgi:hypothetical protein
MNDDDHSDDNYADAGKEEEEEEDPNSTSKIIALVSLCVVAFVVLWVCNECIVTFNV